MTFVWIFAPPLPSHIWENAFGCMVAGECVSDADSSAGFRTFFFIVCMFHQPV